MLQLRRDADLSLKSLGGEILGDVRRERFDDDAAAECGLEGQEHARLFAAAEFTLDGVRSVQCGLELPVDVVDGVDWGPWRPICPLDAVFGEGGGCPKRPSLRRPQKTGSAA